MTTTADFRTQATRTAGRRALQMDDRPPVRVRAPTLVHRIESAHRATVGAARTAIEHAIECGRLLAEAKALMRHGEWLSWVRGNLTFGVRQAQKYMRLAERADALPNANSGAHLSINDALAVVAETIDPPAPTRHPDTRTARTAPSPDHLARLQRALATILDLPEPEVLARHLMTRRADLHVPLERAGQYIARLGIELRSIEG